KAARPGWHWSSSEPSWQSASPSHAQRCGMQWPLWHWKLEAGHSRQFFSSLMSPQSLSLSHCQMLLMQFPLEHLYWLGRHVFSGAGGTTETSCHEAVLPEMGRKWESFPLSSRAQDRSRRPLVMAETGAAARGGQDFTFLPAGVVLHGVAVGTVTPELPAGQHGAGHPLGALAAAAVVGPGQAEQAAGPGDAGVLPWSRAGGRGQCQGRGTGVSVSPAFGFRPP
uniref:Uncharacterized protein n=1 Tax=Cyanistes caeruleus TaxID=156563 RepID=A0A8C0UB37_CYACU